MDKKKYRILVIEDNPGDFVIVEDFLVESLFAPQIIHARDFKHALEILTSPGQYFDIILLDLSLPDNDGDQLISEIMGVSSMSPIIILTGFADMNFAIHAISMGIEDYLLKDDLNAAILYKSITYSIERKKSKSELKDSEKRYSNLFHLSPQPMWVFDTETFRFVQVNKAAVQKYGFTEEEFLTMSILDIRPRSDIETVSQIIHRNRETDNQLFTGRFQHINKAGETIEVEIYSTPLTIHNRPLRSVIAYDITEKIQHEQLITKAIIRTQEEERYEIGGELHDNICQILALSQMSLDKLKESLNAETKPWYDNARNTLLTAMEEIRNLSHRLAPAFYDELTLEECFRKLIKTFDVGKKYQILFSFNDEVNDASSYSEMQLSLYRILQEQLRNIEKYAFASEIKVFVLIRSENLYMTTIDNGVGFVMDEQKQGIGFANMKRRIELFGGDMEIDTAPGKGCKIVITVPIKQKR